MYLIEKEGTVVKFINEIRMEEGIFLNQFYVDIITYDGQKYSVLPGKFNESLSTVSFNPVKDEGIGKIPIQMFINKATTHGYIYLD